MSPLGALEAWGYLMVPVIWYLFRRLAGRDITGELIAGTLFGFYIEFATEPLWDYHFALTYYKDTPLTSPLSWGVLMSVVAFLSEKLYSWSLGREADPSDGRLLLFDVLAGILLGLPVETLGYKAGVWDYNYGVLGWTWGTIPIFRMPYEALVGYALLMLVAPSFVRHWRRGLSPLRWAVSDEPIPE